jgi:hypothetical protein
MSNNQAGIRVRTSTAALASGAGEDDVGVSTNGGFAALADLPLMTEKEKNTKTAPGRDRGPALLDLLMLGPAVAGPPAERGRSY